jgi:hypothetical protein
MSSLFCPQNTQIGNAHTEWQWPLSGVHSMVKPDQPGKGGGARPPPFTLRTVFTIIVVYTPAERPYTHLHNPYFSSIPIYSRSGCAVQLNPLSCTQRVKGGKANYFFSFAKSQICLGITTQFQISKFFFLSVPVR